MKLYELLRILAPNNRELKNIQLGYADIDWHDIECDALSIIRFADAEVESMWADYNEKDGIEYVILLQDHPIEWNDMDIIKYGHRIFE